MKLKDNRKNLIYAILVGSAFGLVMFSFIVPNDWSFILQADSEGFYPRVINKEKFDVEVDQREDGVLLVTIKNHRTGQHYFWAVFLAYLFGYHHFNSLKKYGAKRAAAEKKAEDAAFLSSSQIPNEDPNYEKFLLEDDNRRLFPRAHLEEDFQAWLTECEPVDETQT